jgi:hypothetical protein
LISQTRFSTFTQLYNILFVHLSVASTTSFVSAMQTSSWILSSRFCQLACLLFIIYVSGGVGAQSLDIQRQQLPFGELIFPVLPRVSNESAVLDSYRTKEALEVNLPKIGAMADSHTDDGSVISRHYSATLVESAWRNRLNNSTMEYFLESTKVDVSSLSLFAAVYLSSVMLMSLTRKV